MNHRSSKLKNPERPADLLQAIGRVREHSLSGESLSTGIGRVPDWPFGLYVSATTSLLAYIATCSAMFGGCGDSRAAQDLVGTGPPMEVTIRLTAKLIPA